MASAKSVAAYLIRKAGTMSDGDGNDLTNLKLQKLLYYAQVEHFKKFGKPLFKEKIEAWQYGPVVPDVYEELRHCGAYVITELDTDTSAANKIKPEEAEFLDKFWEKYSDFSAWKLVKETHKPNSAWFIIYQNGKGNHETIPTNLLKTADTL